MSIKENYSIPILKHLLENGALLCSQDSLGVTPLKILQTQPAKLNVMQFISLKCLAVKVLREFSIKPSIEDVGNHCADVYDLHA